MRLSSSSLRTGLLMLIIPLAVLCVRAQGPDAPSQETAGKDAPANESKGMPPRATPGDYQAHTQAGAATLAAEFVRHSVPTPEATYSTEDFVVVEAGLFGPPQARLRLSTGDFSLRINGKKVALPSQPYGLAFSSLKDPEWEPPAKAKTDKPTLDAGGGKPDDSFKPVVRMPIELKRTMQQRVQRASLPEGDRALPAAGLLFFEYRGKPESIRSIELIYSGPGGSATLALQP
jgi:hypothetical protein